MAGDRILALDAGTQSVRALLFDPAGGLVAMARVPYEPYVSPRPGWAEQDAELYWRSLGEACRRLWATPGVDPASVAGVALTGQRGTVVVTDEDGRPLRPAIVWLDARRTGGLASLGVRYDLAFRILGVAGTVASFRADTEANWIERFEPDVWKRTRRYLFLSGLLSHRLTGRFVDSIACQVGYGPFDYRHHAWSVPGDWRWRASPIEPSMLPELVPPTGSLGEITREASAETGIPAGLPVVAAGADKACEVLGSGALEPTIACIGYGSTATVNTTHRRYVEAVPFVPPYPAAVPGAYCLEWQIYRGYWMVEWFKRQFGRDEVALAGERGVEPEALLDDLLTASPPGAMGLILQPYWSPGVRVPGSEARGAIVGFNEVHTRAHVYRAVLEGLAYALRDGLERSERRSGVRVTELRLSGGGSRGAGVARLTADVFGLPVALPHTSETAGLGAAIDAAVGLGIHRDVESAVAAMTRVGSVVEPDRDAAALYDELYRRVYLRLYGRLRPLYAELGRIVAGRGGP